MGSVHCAQQHFTALLLPQVNVYLVRTEKVMGAHAENLETFIVMEYCDQGTLAARLDVIWRLLKEDSNAAMRWITSTLIDIAGGLQYLHNMGLIHGDLKCNNILLQSTRADARDFCCKITDVGCSRLLSASKEAILTGTYGVPTHAAPELLKEGRLTQVCAESPKASLMLALSGDPRPCA